MKMVDLIDNQGIVTKPLQTDDTGVLQLVQGVQGLTTVNWDNNMVNSAN